jgi:hypothetical protein
VISTTSSTGVSAQARGIESDFRLYDRITAVLPFIVSRQIDGVGTAGLDLVFRRNTIVRQYDLQVHAAVAKGNSLARDLGQVRTSDDRLAVVIDFGMPRTVKSVQAPAGTAIQQVSAWTGAKFADPFYTADGATAGSNQAVFASEIRTDRLMLTLSQAIDSARAGELISLAIPDLPADLELRINDGPPVWSNPGPAQPGPSLTPLSTEVWSKDATRLVPLADALNTLLADPLADDDLPCRLVLTSKVPGRLALSAATAAAARLSYIHRVRFGNGSDTSTDLDFSAEGEQTLSLAMPVGSATRRIEALRLTALAKLPDTRTLPPLGPDWPSVPNRSPAEPLAELALDSSHAACVRLDTQGLAQLSGVRLPLGSGADGAEVRVVLWQADAQGEPASAIDAGTSEIVTLSAGGTSGADDWHSFAFKTPIDLSRTPAPWAAVVVSRGTVLWRLSDAAHVSAANASGPAGDVLMEPPGATLRRGPPSGPWRLLPALLRSSDGHLMDARGRVRVTGLAGKARPIAPLVVSLVGLDGSTVEVTPTAKGTTVTLSFDPAPALAAGDPSLRIVSRVAGTLTLRDVELIWTETSPTPPAT